MKNIWLSFVCFFFLINISYCAPIDLAQKKKSLVQKADVLYNKSVMLYETNPESAFIYASKARDIYHWLGQKNKEAYSNLHLGTIYKTLGDYNEASRIILEAYDYFTTSNDLLGKTKSLLTIGELIRSTNIIDSAIAPLKEGYSIAKKLNNPKLIAKFEDRLAAVFYEAKKYDSCFYYAKKAVAYGTKNKDYELLGSSNILIGAYYKNVHKPNEAINYHNKALYYYSKINSKDIPLVYINLGYVYCDMKDYDKVIFYAKKGYETAKKLNIKVYIFMASSIASMGYDSIRDYKNALKYFYISSDTRDAIFRSKNFSFLQITKYKNDNEKKAKENKILQQQQIIQQNKIRISRIIIYSMLAGLVIAVISFYIIYNSKRKLKYANFQLLRLNQEITNKNAEINNVAQQLKKSNADKDKFFSIIAHDLKSPFNTIMGFSDLLYESYEDFGEAEKKQFIKNIKDSSDNAFCLLENLLEWSRIQIGRTEFNPELFDINLFVIENILLQKLYAQKKGIQLMNAITSEKWVYADKNMTSAIIRNLLSNAIKFTSAGVVIIDTDLKQNYIEVYIKDNGVGMPSSVIEKLFRIDETTKSEGTAGEKGTGLGLVLCKEFAERQGGKIWAESTPGKGSIFHFTLPTSPTAQ